MNQEHQITNRSKSKGTKEWFDSVVSSLRVDQLALEEGVATDEKTDFYHSMIHGSAMDHLRQGSEIFHGEVTLMVLKNYLQGLAPIATKLTSLAFDFTGTKLLVWAEIKEEDEAVEDHLILLEARLNVEHSEVNFGVSTTIVEEVDSFPIPDHYCPVGIEEEQSGKM